jgi:cathepsin L
MALAAFVAIALGTIAALAQSGADVFEAHLAKHGFQFSSDEYDMRKALFLQRLATVNAQNALPGARWKATTNRFSHLTENERAVMRGYRRGITAARRAASGASALETIDEPRKEIPEHISWRHLKTADHVRDQGSCGSCWAIATVSVLEAHYEIYSANGGPTRTFSPQQTLECTPNPQECGGTGGCQGATVELGMAWILKNGVGTDDDVPYTAQDGSCPGANSEGVDSSQVLAKADPVETVNAGSSFGLMAWQTLQSNVDYPLAHALATYGPVAVSAAASGWFEYSGGVFDGCQHDYIVDHAIVAYGYGKEGNNKYWLIRNSWGADWGEEGFIRLLRHDDGDHQCGTDTDPSQGLGCKGGPATVTVCGACGILYDSVVPHFAGSPANATIVKAAMQAQASYSDDSLISDASSASRDKEGRFARIMRHESKYDASA